MKKTLALALLLAGSQAFAADDGPRTFRPRFDPGPGTYTGTQRVRVWSPTSGSDIYCTTDGSTPTVASPRYTAPFTVSTTTAIRCVAKKWRRPVSYIGTASFIIEATPSPVYLVGNATAVGRSESSSLLSVIEGVFFLAAAAGGGSSVAAVSLDISGAVAVFAGSTGGASANEATLSSSSLYTSPSQYYAAAMSTCSSLAIRSTGTKTYFCDCQAGAEFGCVAGNDANAGTDPAAPKQTWTALGTAARAMSAGDTVALCKGGAWAGVTVSLNNAACAPDPTDMSSATSTYTCDIRDYTPTTFTGTAKPKIAWTTGNLFTIGISYSSPPMDGYRFFNLNTIGTGSADSHYYLYGDVNDVYLCGNHLDGGSRGLILQSTTVRGDGTNDFHADRVYYVGNHSKDVGSYTINGGAHVLKVDANYFENDGSTNIYDHVLYLGGVAYDGVVAHGIYEAGSTDFDVTNNTLIPGAGGAACDGVVFVAHGQMTRFNIENNDVQGGSAPTERCWGIALDDGGYAAARRPAYFRNLSIKRNTITDTGHLGIGIAESDGAIVENNLINMPSGSECIVFNTKAANTSYGDDVGTGVVARNNTCYQGVKGWRGVTTKNGGTGHVVSNNTTWFGSDKGFSPTCFVDTLGSTSFAFFGNNACYGYSSWGTTFDVSRVTTDPLYTSAPTDFTPQSGSPLNSAGSNTYKAATDFYLKTRPNPPTIGAVER